MTVKELIEHLQTLTGDLPVAICTDDFYGYYTVIMEDDVFADRVESKSHNKFDAVVVRVY